jgi:hypothetical protein
MVATNVEQFPCSCVSEEVDIPTGSIVEIDEGAARFVRRRQHYDVFPRCTGRAFYKQDPPDEPRACATQIDQQVTRQNLRSRVSLLTVHLKSRLFHIQFHIF